MWSCSKVRGFVWQGFNNRIWTFIEFITENAKVHHLLGRTRN